MKSVITYLILQELKYVQLIAGLQKLNLRTDDYLFSLLEVIPPVMGVPLQNNNTLPEISDELSEVYAQYLGLAGNLPVGSCDELFEQLAEACYCSLSLQIQLESKKPVA